MYMYKPRYPAGQLGLNCRLSYFVFASSEGSSKSVHICADFLEGPTVTNTVNRERSGSVVECLT